MGENGMLRGGRNVFGVFGVFGEATDFEATDSGAGEGNRTLVFSLEGYGSTIELHPRLLLADRPATATAGLTSERQIPDALPAAADPRPDSGRRYRLG